MTCLHILLSRSSQYYLVLHGKRRGFRNLFSSMGLSPKSSRDRVIPLLVFSHGFLPTAAPPRRANFLKLRACNLFIEKPPNKYCTIRRAFQIFSRYSTVALTFISSHSHTETFFGFKSPIFLLLCRLLFLLARVLLLHKPILP